MTRRASLGLEVPADGPADAAAAKAGASSNLASTAIGDAVVIVGISLEADVRAWLDAIGIAVGESLVVLRRAAFGGPLHVRTRAGGEFALHVDLARRIEVRPRGGAEGGGA